MTDTPDWAQTLDAVKRVPGKGAKSSRVPLQQIQEGQDYSRQRALADTAVAMGAVDTGDDFDGAEWIADQDIPSIPGKIDTVFGAVQQVQFGLITLADLASTRRRVPFWVSPNPFEYVSFPRSLLNRDDGAKPTFTIPAGTLALSAVSIDEATTNNQVRFIAGGGTPPTHVYCGLWKVDQTNGDMHLVYDFGDVRGDIDTGALTYEVALEMTSDMLLDAGEIMTVGILPVGGSFAVGAIPRQQIVPTPILYPQASTELKSGLSALPSTITDASLDHTSTHRVLVSVGQALPETVTPVTITIPFGQYDDTGNWASPSCVNFFSSSNARWRITSGVLLASGTENFAPIDYDMGFILKQKCATDDMFAEFTVGAGWPTVITRPTRVYVHCANDGTAAVGLFVSQLGTGNATVTIQTVTSMATRTGTVRATGSDVFSAVIDDVFRLEAVTDETTGIVTYTGYRNGNPITDCVWTDTGGVSSTGVAWRRAGYGSSMWTNINVRYPAGGAKQFRCGDLSAAA